MPTPPFPLLPDAELAKLVLATRAQVAATLAAAAINKLNKPLTYEHVLEIHRDFLNMMYPSPEHGHYQAWVKKFDPKKEIA